MTERVLNAYRVDRTAVAVAALADPSDESAYWLTRAPEERWRAVELMRQINYGAAATGRLQRVLEVAQLQRG